MKKTFLPLLMLILVSFSASTNKLTDDEREMIIKELTHSQKEFMRAVEDLSLEQLNYKPDDETWSIAEITEHLAITENTIFGLLEQSLKTPADASRRSEVTMNDAQILGLIEDRTNKVKTQQAMEPTGQFGGFEETLETFNDRRENHIDYIRDTEDDLRNHYAALPFGTVDGVQIVLFLTGHTDRHVQQLHEVMSDPDFPEN